MFEQLSRFSIILVGGPQRAGTTITARMVAADTGKGYIDEDAFYTQDKRRWQDIVSNCDNVVIHCPTMTAYLHEFGDRADLAVVFVWRSEKEIQASRDRLRWDGDGLETTKYPAEWHLPTCPQTKWNFWNEYQICRIRKHFTVYYQDLKKHSLWLEPEQRLGFTARQWRQEAG